MADTDTPSYHLVTIRPFFNPHTKEAQETGTTITDPEVVDKILDSHHSSFVVKVPETDWEPKPAKADKPLSSTAPVPTANLATAGKVA